MAVFPEQISGPSVERVHDVVRLREIHDAVADKRGSLLIAELLRPGPGELQVADIAFVDLVERAVSPAVIRAPPHEPVIRTGIGRDFVANRREAFRQGWFRDRTGRAQHRGYQESGRLRQVRW
jgi:hypothetical protein